MDAIETINPDRLYSVREVCALLSPDKPLHPDTVYRIPPAHLPRTRVGPRRGLIRFRGRDVLAYLDRGRSAA